MINSVRAAYSALNIVCLKVIYYFMMQSLTHLYMDRLTKHK